MYSQLRKTFYLSFVVFLVTTKSSHCAISISTVCQLQYKSWSRRVHWFNRQQFNFTFFCRISAIIQDMKEAYLNVYLHLCILVHLITAFLAILAITSSSERHKPYYIQKVCPPFVLPRDYTAMFSFLFWTRYTMSLSVPYVIQLLDKLCTWQIEYSFVLTVSRCKGQCTLFTEKEILG